MAYQYPPIDNDVIFESFIKDLFNALYRTNSFQLYRKNGAKQYGIDIISIEKEIVIQCKQKDTSRTQKTLENELIRDFDESIEMSKKLSFSFSTFILASTTKKFSKVQEHAISLATKNNFNVLFWSWTEIQSEIHKYENIIKEYYPNYAKSDTKKQMIKSNIVNVDFVHKQIIHTKNIIQKIQPPDCTIGANRLLKKTIQDKFKRLADERAKRFEKKSAYSVMYKNFFRDFTQSEEIFSIAEVWRWDERIAKDIIAYLDDKYANTIAGKKAEARKYNPSRRELYGKEKKLLAHLDLKIDSPEVDNWLLQHFGVTSHKELNYLQHRQWVCYLEEKVENLSKS